MQNFPSIPTDIIGGIAEFKFARLQDASSFSVLDSVVQANALSQIASAWYTGYSTISELKFSEEQSVGDHGSSFVKTLEGFFPGDDENILPLMNEMAGQYFLLYLKDNDELMKIVGSVNEPMIFTFKFSSANPKGKKGYTWQFMGAGRSKSPIWDPDSLAQGSSSSL